MTYTQFVNKSHESVHDDLVAFLKAKFAIIHYESFFHMKDVLPWKFWLTSFEKTAYISVYLLEEESFTIIMILKHLENQQSHKFLLPWLRH